jgi:hypothetical protein
MPTTKDELRVAELRTIRAQANIESWSTEKLDGALRKLYRPPRAPRKTK